MARGVSSKNNGAEVTNLYLPVRIKKLGREMAEKKNLSLSQLVTELIERNALENEEAR
jgi:hypothetical protein